MRIDYLIFGYKKITPRTDCAAAVSTSLIKAGLSARVGIGGEICIFAPSVKKYRAALSGIDFDVSGLLGLPGLIYGYRKRIGAILAIAFVVLFIAISSTLVWDVRVEGNENLTAAQLAEQLETVGLFVGASWNSLSRSEVETAALKQIPDLAWININRRGVVAYVTVKEKKSYFESEEGEGYSNIVATVDCVIEEINVAKGVAAVKAGETVKAGQLLISGVIPAELGGGFVRAEGEVVGRIKESISVSVPREETEKVYGDERLISVTVEIFGFSLNIFKSYGNSDKECVIIEDTENCAVFGSIRLPLKITRTYAQERYERRVTYDDAQLVKIAAYRLSHLKALRLSDAELLKARASGDFTEDGYTAVSDVTVLRKIGEERWFSK